MPSHGRDAGGESSVRSRTRRRFLGATAGIGAGLVSGYAGGFRANQAAQSVSVAAVGGGEGELFRRLINEYVQDDTGINVDVSLFPYANLFERTNSVLSTNGMAFDIVFMDDPWFPLFAQYVDPIRQWLPSDIPEDQFIDTTIDIATWPAPRGPNPPSAQGQEQQLKGLVVVGNTQLFAYNQQFYDQVNESEPNTWQDVLRAGRKIDEQIDGTSGYNIRGRRGNPIMANFFSLGMSRIGDMFDGNWRYRWDDQNGAETVSFYVNDLKSISPDGVASFDSDQVLNSLGDGSAAQAPAWPAAASILLNPEQADEADNIRFTVIPEGQRRAPQQGNWITGINSFVSDAKKRAAGQVLRSFVSQEAQEMYVDLGGVPFRRDTFQNNMDAQPWFPALFESLQTAQWRPRTPLWSELEATQGRLLNTALTGQISPQRAITQMNDEVESILEQAGYYE